MEKSTDTAILKKQEIRRHIKTLAASYKTYKASSAQLCKNIISSVHFNQSDIILAYMALPDEADVSEVIRAALECGKKVFIPKVFSDKGIIEFFEYKKGVPTQKGAFGIQEPVSGSQPGLNHQPAVPQAQLFVPEKLPQPAPQILVLVPARAFTQDGRRLGRGKGFYDKYLARLDPLRRIKKAEIAGVCLPFQLLEDLPTDANDIRMDFIFQV